MQLALPSAGHSWPQLGPEPFRVQSRIGNRQAIVLARKAPIFLFQTYRDFFLAPMNELLNLLNPQCLRFLRLPKSCFKLVKLFKLFTLFKPSNWMSSSTQYLGVPATIIMYKYEHGYIPTYISINNPKCTPISSDSTNTKQGCYS